MSFKDPETVLDQLVLGEGRVVADLGVGSGAYALSAARRVGGTGKVYAIDIQKHLLERLKNAAKTARLHNVEIIWGDIEKSAGTKIKNGVVDVAIISNALFQTEDKSAVAREAHRILKNGGRALVVDWSETSGVLGPAAEHIVPQEEARDVFERNGFSHERDISAGEHHYGIIFRKK